MQSTGPLLVSRRRPDVLRTLRAGGGGGERPAGGGGQGLPRFSGSGRFGPGDPGGTGARFLRKDPDPSGSDRNRPPRLPSDGRGGRVGTPGGRGLRSGSRGRGRWPSMDGWWICPSSSGPGGFSGLRRERLIQEEEPGMGSEENPGPLPPRVLSCHNHQVNEEENMSSRREFPDRGCHGRSRQSRFGESEIRGVRVDHIGQEDPYRDRRRRVRLCLLLARASAVCRRSRDGPLPEAPGETPESLRLRQCLRPPWRRC